MRFCTRGNIAFAVVTLSAAASVTAAALHAQNGRPQAPAVFKSAVQYVALDVVATDRNDRIVRDLRQDEFAVVEHGRTQTIKNFTFVEVPLVNNSWPTGARALDPGETWLPARDVASNGRNPKSGRAVVFVINEQSEADPEVQHRVKTLLADFIRTVSLDDQVAITYLRRSDISQDFTNDVARLIASASHVSDSAGIPSSRSRSGARDFAAKMDTVFDALDAAAQPRKTVVLISSSACDPSEDTQTIFCKPMIDHARKSGISIYGVDPRPQSFDLDASNALKVVSAMTGGLAFANATDLHGVAQQILSDSGSYYLLGFYPDPVVADGKFHDVSVSVRRAGIRVRARSGYVAPTAKASATTPRGELGKTLGAGADNPGLTLRAFAAPVSVTDAASGKIVRTAVTIELTYPSEPGQKVNDDVILGMVAVGPDGEIESETSRPLRLSGKDDTPASSTAPARIIINDVIDLPTRPVILRIGITSKSLGKSGSVHLNVSPPDPSSPAVQLGGLVVGSRTAPPTAIGADAFEGMLPFQPVLSRVFPSNGVMRIFTRAFWKPKDAAEPLVVVTLTVLTAQTSAIPSNVMSRDVRTLTGHVSADGRVVAPIDMPVSLAKLPPGGYAVQLDAQILHGPVATRTFPFTVR